MNKQTAPKAGIALLLAMIPFTMLASGTIGAPEQKGSNSETLDSEFLRAINKGDVHKIKDLAAQGAQVDPPGPAALDLDGLQVVEGTFRYGIRPIACLAAPAPMRRAIETARPDTVEALLQLGADAKREFCEDASTAYFFSMRALYGALANGNSYSARGGGGFIYISGGFVYSSIRPIPAHSATYLSMATELSLGTANGKRRKEYQQIMELLRRAGSPEHAASERATATVAEQASAAGVPKPTGESHEASPATAAPSAKSVTASPASIATPSAGTALIYVYRTRQFAGGLVTPVIFMNRDYFFVLRDGTYAPREVPPGTVAVTGAAPNAPQYRGNPASFYPPPWGLFSLADCPVDWMHLGEARSEDVARCVSDLNDTKTALLQFLAASELVEPDPRVKRCSHLPNIRTNKLGQQVDYWQRGEVTDCLAGVESALAWLTDTVPVDRLQFQVEAGKTYYVRWSFSWRHHPRPGLFELVDGATGAKETKDLRLTAHLTGAEYAAEQAVPTGGTQVTAAPARGGQSAGTDTSAVAQICDAARDGDVAKVESLIESNPDLVFSRDADGNTPLHWAAKSGHAEVAELLLTSRASVDATAKNGQTPLHMAAYHGHRDVAELLLANKADANAKDVNGLAPLHYAAVWGNANMAELLLATNAEVDIRDKRGVTPLHLAASGDKKEVAELLLANRADVNAKDDTGTTPLKNAEIKRLKDMEELLRKHGGHK